MKKHATLFVSNRIWRTDPVWKWLKSKLEAEGQIVTVVNSDVANKAEREAALKIGEVFTAFDVLPQAEKNEQSETETLKQFPASKKAQELADASELDISTFVPSNGWKITVTDVREFLDAQIDEERARIEAMVE